MTVGEGNYTIRKVKSLIVQLWKIYWRFNSTYKIFKFCVTWSLSNVFLIFENLKIFLGFNSKGNKARVIYVFYFKITSLVFHAYFSSIKIVPKLVRWIRSLENFCSCYNFKDDISGTSLLRSEIMINWIAVLSVSVNTWHISTFSILYFL